MQKSKMAVWGGLTNSCEKKREVKSKGEKERYKHLNAEFQRIARRDKKAFLSNQCKQIEENNRMRKTRELFKKIRDTKGTFHVKMGSIKDRNGMDLTEVEDIKNGALEKVLLTLNERDQPLISPEELRNALAARLGVGEQRVQLSVEDV